LSDWPWLQHGSVEQKSNDPEKIVLGKYWGESGDFEIPSEDPISWLPKNPGSPYGIIAPWGLVLRFGYFSPPRIWEKKKGFFFWA